MLKLVFDLMMWGVVKGLTPPSQKKQFGRQTTSMEPLAFDALQEQAERSQLNYREPTGDIHRDIEDDGGPDW